MRTKLAIAPAAVSKQLCKGENASGSTLIPVRSTKSRDGRTEKCNLVVYAPMHTCTCVCRNSMATILLLKLIELFSNFLSSVSWI